MMNNIYYKNKRGFVCNKVINIYSSKYMTFVFISLYDVKVISKIALGFFQFFYGYVYKQLLKYLEFTTEFNSCLISTF